jgi:hypothetical protein
VGIPSYWITSADSAPPDGDVQLIGYGALTDLWRQVKSEGIEYNL